MKKTLVTFVCLLLSLPAAVLPLRSDYLMHASLSQTGPLGILVDQIIQKTADQLDPAFYSIKIEAVSALKGRSVCREYSKSAGFLKVEIDFGHEFKSYFFSTRGESANLKLCPNQ